MLKCKNLKDIRNDLDNGLVTSLALFNSSVDKALKYQSDLSSGFNVKSSNYR